MRRTLRGIAFVVAAGLLSASVGAHAAPWSVTGYLRQASGSSAKVLAVAVVVTNEDGGPVTGLEPKDFAVDYLIPTPTTSLFFPSEISTQKPDGFAEHDPGTYIMYATTTHNAGLVRGVSVRVFAPNGARVQRAATFLSKSN
ncbi:MAG TPA: hypothetical protein VII68_06575 [Casimicrobiaceae bacterium]|jgi:hypothetical protein